MTCEKCDGELIWRGQGSNPSYSECKKCGNTGQLHPQDEKAYALNLRIED